MSKVNKKTVKYININKFEEDTNNSERECRVILIEEVK